MLKDYLKHWIKATSFKGRMNRNGLQKMFTVDIMVFAGLLMEGFILIYALSYRLDTKKSVIRVHVFGIIGGVIIVGLFFLLLFPFLSCLVRRLHDVGRSGWYLPLVMVPYLLLLGCRLCFPVPLFVQIVFMGAGGLLFGYVHRLLLQDSQPFPNQYGPVPTTI